MQIIVRSYEHVNRSFKNWNTPKGRYIRNKDEYERAMKEEGMISSEEAAERSKTGLKKYKLSDNAKGIISHAQLISGKGGKVKLGSGLVDKMIKIGAIKKKGYGLEYLPAKYQIQGGF